MVCLGISSTAVRLAAQDISLIRCHSPLYRAGPKPQMHVARDSSMHAEDISAQVLMEALSYHGRQVFPRDLYY